MKDITMPKPEDIPPMSTTMKCIINLTVQYFLIYTAVAVGRAPGRGERKAKEKERRETKNRREAKERCAAP